MDIELRQWYFGDEDILINLYNNYDRSYCDLNYPEPGQCDHDEANWHIRCSVDMGCNWNGWARAIVVNQAEGIPLDGLPDSKISSLIETEEKDKMVKRVVGYIKYTKRTDLYDANCDVSVILLPEACGHGVGSEALKQMIKHAFYVHNYEGVYATMLDSNKAARRMCEKAGMTYCGVDDSQKWTFHGEPCTKVVYAIQRPKKEIAQKGVAIKPWERRDIDALAHLFETYDGRYDDVSDPLADIRRYHQYDENWEPSPEWLHERMLFAMHDYVDQWNVDEEQGGDICRAIVNDGEIVGLVSLRMQNGKRSIDGLLGYMMMSEHCGKGIATKAVSLMLDEVFRLRKLHRVTARVYGPNKASIRVLEKNGFQLEGVLREAVLCEGKPTDYLVYGLLSS